MLYFFRKEARGLPCKKNSHGHLNKIFHIALSGKKAEAELFRLQPNAPLLLIRAPCPFCVPLASAGERTFPSTGAALSPSLSFRPDFPACENVEA